MLVLMGTHTGVGKGAFISYLYSNFRPHGPSFLTAAGAAAVEYGSDPLVRTSEGGRAEYAYDGVMILLISRR